MARDHRMESTKHSNVVLCTREGCTWRGMTHTTASAWRLLAQHAHDVHHDSDAADYARKRAQRPRRVS